MMAWVSPDVTDRSTPRWISFGPSSVDTDTCRSRMSSVAMLLELRLLEPFGSPKVVSVVAEVNEDGLGPVLADPARIGGDRLGRRKVQHLAGAYVEAGPVQPALDLASLDVTLGQRYGCVRTLILHRVDIVAVTDKRDLDPAHLDTEHPAVGDIGQVGGANKLTHQSLASTGGSPM